MDDQEPILKMLSKMLNQMGYEATFATDGAKAIDLYRKAYKTLTPFDLVILDFTIPGGMGGATTIPKLLRIDPKVKAVVSSGYSNDPIMANYQNYGFCGVVPKPYAQAQLSELLNKIFDKKEQPLQCNITVSFMKMEKSNKTDLLNDAIIIAKQILSGEIDPNKGCIPEILTECNKLIGLSVSK